jgi:hypothetical protein
VRTGLRARVGLVMETGDAMEQHHMATLFGYGAEAVHPWLAFETVATLFAEAHGKADADTERPGPALAQSRYRTALEKGLLKVLAKMGISTLSSYCGAQTFDALGLGGRRDRPLLRRHGLAGGRSVGCASSAKTCCCVTAGRSVPMAWRRRALADHGRVRFRKDGEVHAWAPQTVLALQQAVGSARVHARRHEPRRGVAHLCRTRRGGAPVTVRDLLALRPASPIAHRGGRAGRGHSRPLRLVGDVARRALARGA